MESEFESHKMLKYSMHDIIKTLQTAFLSFILCIYKSNVLEKFCAQQRLKGKTKVRSNVQKLNMCPRYCRRECRVFKMPRHKRLHLFWELIINF